MNNPPPQFFGGFGADNMQHLPPDIASQMFDSHMFFEDPHDAKRRRIARVRDGREGRGGIYTRELRLLTCWFHHSGVRYVSQEEDQVRWQDAVVHAVSELQDGLRLHAR